MSDADARKHTCTPCLRGFHAGCTIPAKCRHLNCPTDEVAVKAEPPVIVAKRSHSANDRSLIERCYLGLAHLRKYTPPQLWDRELIALVTDLELRLNVDATGTIRQPKDAA